MEMVTWLWENPAELFAAAVMVLLLLVFACYSQRIGSRAGFLLTRAMAPLVGLLERSFARKPPRHIDPLDVVTFLMAAPRNYRRLVDPEFQEKFRTEWVAEHVVLIHLESERALVVPVGALQYVDEPELHGIMAKAGVDYQDYKHLLGK